MTELGTALVIGDYPLALVLAERVGEPARQSGWVDYDRAVALTQLARTDEAVAAYRAAEQRFARNDAHGRSVAVYGRAHALDLAGRCEEARRRVPIATSLTRPPDNAV